MCFCGSTESAQVLQNWPASVSCITAVYYNKILQRLPQGGCCLTQIHHNTFSTNDLLSLTSGPERATCTQNHILVQKDFKKKLCRVCNRHARLYLPVVSFMVCWESSFYPVFSINNETELFSGLLQSDTDPCTMI